jgi:hypothetical protein
MIRTIGRLHSLADQNAAGFHRFLVAFFPMRDFLLLAKNLFIAATERGFRKHFAHFQANGGWKISEGDQILGAYATGTV